ncbi:MAG: zinc-binding dehydrogenase, partial [Bacteroidia bacterium]|nr:zinc-binding dehydrogenase [Bacteroidia bacterium]
GGGVALFALQFAIAHGCEVWVTSGSEEKIERAKQLGAKGGVIYKTHDWDKKLLKEAGSFQVIIDGACGEGFTKLIEVADMASRIVFYGGTAGNIPALLPAKVFWKQLSILGSTMGNDNDFEAMLAFVGKHRIEPIIAKEFELSDAERGFRLLKEGSQFGKIVFDNKR